MSDENLKTIMTDNVLFVKTKIRQIQISLKKMHTADSIPNIVAKI